MEGFEKDSVERTLLIPLWSRAIAAKKLPQILPDYDAIRILKEMGEKRPPNVFYHLECAALAGAIRQYDFACEIEDYLKKYPEATIVELGAGLSCLRRQMKNETNPWINIDFEDVIACRKKYIPSGNKERNLAYDITDHRWMEEIDPAHGLILLAAGVLHYLRHQDVIELIDAIGERFPDSRFVFDFVSQKGKTAGNSQIAATGNKTQILFSMENAEKELPLLSQAFSTVRQKSYLEGYPVKDVHYSLLTRMYIASKRDKYFIACIDY